MKLRWDAGLGPTFCCFLPENNPKMLFYKQASATNMDELSELTKLDRKGDLNSPSLDILVSFQQATFF